MTETYLERILVPDSTRSKLLVVVGDRPALPSWTLEDPDFGDSIREARTAFGVESPFLRLVRLDGEPVRDAEFRTLLEFDAAFAAWQPREGLDWLPFSVVADGLEAGPFEGDVSTWTAQVASGVIPPTRIDWARPGWFESTVSWLTDELARLGRSTSGAVEQLSSWPVGSLLAVDTDRGRVVLKCAPPLFAHEPELTRALAAEHPDLLPVVLDVDPARRFMLMEAFGGAPLGAEEPGRWADGLVQIATIQQAWMGRRPEAERVGLEDRSLGVLARELESIITDQGSSPGLDPATRERLVGSLPRYLELIERLQAGPVPETLVHADFHPWNIQRDGDRLVIYDWSDACWGHPFFDVPTVTSRTENLDARATMRSAYLATWSDYASPQILRQALDWAAPLSELHLAISWRRIQAIFEPDGAYPFVDSGVQRHLEFALAATESAESS